MKEMMMTIFVLCYVMGDEKRERESRRDREWIGRNRKEIGDVFFSNLKGDDKREERKRNKWGEIRRK